MQPGSAPQQPQAPLSPDEELKALREQSQKMKRDLDSIDALIKKKQ
jgi:hypothetical protein